MPNIVQFRLYLTKLLQKQNGSTFLWFTVYIWAQVSIRQPDKYLVLLGPAIYPAADLDGIIAGT